MNFLKKKIGYFIITVSVLLIQNLIIFWDHYFNRFIFPGDFGKAYYAKVAFWISAIDSDLFLHWIPTVQIGFPFFLVVNSAFYYPFLWIFPLLGIQYTLDAAVIFQTIHILFGSIGMFVFLQYILKNNKYALVGAFAFQLFGGFYTSSAFPDITRFYALSPWMFYVFTLNFEKSTIERKILFIPLIIYLVITGGYFGTIISSIFMMSTFIILQTIKALLDKEKNWKSLKKIGIVSSLFLIGVVMSTIYLGPFVQYGDKLTRYTDLDSLEYHSFLPVNIPSLFMPSWTGHEVGIKFFNSLYVTLPILILVCFTPLSAIKKYWIFGIMSIIGILMATGDKSIFWEGIGSIFSQLHLSRNPFSDYKIFIIIPLILFAITGLKSIIEKNISLKEFVVRIGFIISWFSLTITYLYIVPKEFSTVWYKILDHQVILSVLIFCLTIFAITFFVKSNFKKTNTHKNAFKICLVSLIVFIMLISFDGFRVISDMNSWKMDSSSGWFAKNNIALEKDGNLIAHTIFENIPNERPERERYDFFVWRGIVNGSFGTNDFSNTQLVSKKVINSVPIYLEYMKMKWTPILLDPLVTDNNKLVLDDEIISKMPDSVNQTSVIQTRYGINDITYNISLPESKLMVENEMYFPGWTATLSYPDKEVHIQAIEVNGVFRAWELPAGDYKMTANFQFPNYITYQIISLVAFVVWIVLLVVFIVKTRKTKSLTNKT